MPKEIKKQITVTEYVCSNCGAVHKSKTKFYKCRITGEEICDNCKEDVHLIEIGTPNNIGDNSDYEVYMMNYQFFHKLHIVLRPQRTSIQVHNYSYHLPPDQLQVTSNHAPL